MEEVTSTMVSRYSAVTVGILAFGVFISGCSHKAQSPSAPIGSGAPGALNIAFLPKAVNNPYFDVAASGGQDAAKELKGSFKQVGPSDSDPAKQASYVDTLVQQQVSAICISASDPDALAPALKRAMAQGVKVVSYDSDVSPDARSVFISQSDPDQIARSQVQLIAKQIGYNGQIAIVSAASTAANQNAWIAIMKQELSKPEYKTISLVQVAYGNDDDQKSFQETQGLLQAYPELKAIVSPTSVGVAAAARAIEASGKTGKVALTGLGTPNLMRKYVQDGTVRSFELWDPSALGYLAYYTASALVEGKISGKPGETYIAGKLGSRKIGANGVVTLGAPTVFDKSNIDKYHF